MIDFPVGAVAVGFILGLLVASLVRHTLAHRCLWCGTPIDAFCSDACDRADLAERQR